MADTPTKPSTTGTAAFAGASAGLDILAGIFGYLSGDVMADAAESRANLLRMEADAEAARYAEEARGFKAMQKMAFVKNGVQISGSPLDILDETMRSAQENISAIRSRGAASALDMENQGSQIRSKGRAALLGGFAGGALKAAKGYYRAKTINDLASGNRRNINGDEALLMWGLTQ